jgi:hypothetical protein
LKVAGTWAFNSALNGWGRVLVHIPEIGARTQQARYDINLGNGDIRSRYLPQGLRVNKWVSLGVMNFSGRPSISLSNETWDGRGDDAIAWDAVAIQPLLAKPRDFVVALGDSYSSGEGASEPAGGDDYYKETDVNGELDDDKGRNACHRSPWAWSRRGVLAGYSRTMGEQADGLDNNLDFQFHACSGARTHNLLPLKSMPEGQAPPANAFGRTGRGQYGEVSQLDKGYLDENTTLVMFSIGGNDARFADVIQQCIYKAPLSFCPDTKLDGESQDMKDSVPGHINAEVGDSIILVLREIHQRAPHARIVLMGYPRLLENLGSCIPLIGTSEAPWLNAMGDVMANMLNRVAAEASAFGIPTWSSDPRDEFEGKAICGSPETIHGAVGDTTAGDKPKFLGLVPPSAQSFHPKISGTALYAQSLQETMGRMGQ